MLPNKIIKSKASRRNLVVDRRCLQKHLIFKYLQDKVLPKLSIPMPNLPNILLVGLNVGETLRKRLNHHGVIIVILPLLQVNFGVSQIPNVISLTILRKAVKINLLEIHQMATILYLVLDF